MDNPNRPYIICNMMTSLDGKITFGTVDGKDVGFSAFTSYMPYYIQMEAKYGKDWSFILGRITMDEVDSEEKFSIDEFENTPVDFDNDFCAKSDYETYAISVDTKGTLRWKENVREVEGINYSLIMIVTKQTPAKYLAFLQSKNISYIFGGENEVDFKLVLSKLKEKFNINKILLEGGGSINGSILDLDLIDEISLMILPFAVNNIEAPELFYTKLKNPRMHNFKLVELEKVTDDIVWLKYLRQ